MKILFTAKEYARLLELVYLGLGVAGARPDDPDSTPERYAPIAEKAFDLAVPMGCGDLVEADANGHYFPADKLTDGIVREKLEEFLEDVFWSELVSRLSERDLRTELGSTKSGNELSEEQEHRLREIEDSYWREFENAGVDHLVAIRGGQG